MYTNPHYTLHRKLKSTAIKEKPPQHQKTFTCGGVFSLGLLCFTANKAFDPL